MWGKKQLPLLIYWRLDIGQVWLWCLGVYRTLSKVCRKHLQKPQYASFPAQPGWLSFSQVLSNVVQYFHLPIQLSKRLGKGSKQTAAVRFCRRVPLKNNWLSGRWQRFAMNKNMLTFTSKVQRSPLSVDTLARSAPARLDVSHVADIVDLVTRSKAFHRDESVGRVGVSDGRRDAASHCGSQWEEFN